MHLSGFFTIFATLTLGTLAVPLDTDISKRSDRSMNGPTALLSARTIALEARAEAKATFCSGTNYQGSCISTTVFNVCVPNVPDFSAIRIAKSIKLEVPSKDYSLRCELFTEKNCAKNSSYIIKSMPNIDAYFPHPNQQWMSYKCKYCYEKNPNNPCW